MRSLPDRLADWRGEWIVVDCASPFLAIGKLADATREYLELTEADLHDLRDTGTSRELYVVKSARYGVQRNRDTLIIRMLDVVGVSRLADVTVE